jgi:hypothetical protein
MLRVVPVLLLALLAGCAQAQMRPGWRETPDVIVVTESAGDPRIALVEEAVRFWNKTLEEIGSAFRLGPVRRLEAKVPEQAVKALGASVLNQTFDYAPEKFAEFPKGILVMLSSENFISFAGPFLEPSKRVVGIKSMSAMPFTIPNVARNVIAHELGHAIGLSHNDDPTTLMCGRPAPCRPMEFRSSEPRMFPLKDEERRLLLSLYPADWKPAR